MTSKVYDATTVDPSEPTRFTIRLTHATTQEVRELQFEAWSGDPPADAVTILGRMARVDRNGDQIVDIGNGMADFMDATLMGDGPVRWRAMIADKDWKIKADVIAWAIETIQEGWTGRP